MTLGGGSIQTTENKKAERPYLQGYSAINMNLVGFRPHLPMGFLLKGNCTENPKYRVQAVY